MAHLHNYNRNQRSSSWFSDIGNKVKTATEMVGTAHTLHNMGKLAFQGIKAVAPLVATAGLI